MQTDLFYTESSFASFAVFFSVVSKVHERHPLFDRNVLRDMYRMAQFNPVEHTLDNAAEQGNEELMDYLLNEGIISEDEGISAIIAAVNYGNINRMYDFCRRFSPDRTILFSILRSESEVFEMVYDMFELSDLFKEELMWRAIKGSDENVFEVIVERHQLGNLEGWLTKAIVHANEAIISVLLNYARVTEKHLVLAISLGWSEGVVGEIEEAIASFGDDNEEDSDEDVTDDELPEEDSGEEDTDDEL